MRIRRSECNTAVTVPAAASSRADWHFHDFWRQFEMQRIQICVVFCLCNFVFTQRRSLQDAAPNLQERDLMARSAALIRESFKAEAEGRLHDALNIATKLPQDAFAVYRQGKLLFKMDQLGEALKAFNAVVSAEPMMHIAAAYKAFVHYRLGQFKACSVAAAQALNSSITDNRAAVALRLCIQSKRSGQGKYRRLLALHELASSDQHARGGRDPRTGRNHSQPVGDASRPHARTSRGLALVSSANSLYFDCLSNLVGSAQLREPAMRVVVYDLGLDGLERAVAAAWRGAEVVPFPFARHPPHVRNLRNYAWKPLVYEHALERLDLFLYQARALTRAHPPPPPSPLSWDDGDRRADAVERRAQGTRLSSHARSRPARTPHPSTHTHTPIPPWPAEGRPGRQPAAPKSGGIPAAAGPPAAAPSL